MQDDRRVPRAGSSPPDRAFEMVTTALENWLEHLSRALVPPARTPCNSSHRHREPRLPFILLLAQLQIEGHAHVAHEGPPLFGHTDVRSVLFHQAVVDQVEEVGFHIIHIPADMRESASWSVSSHRHREPPLPFISVSRRVFSS